jgi:hypothetical protein
MDHNYVFFSLFTKEVVYYLDILETDIRPGPTWLLFGRYYRGSGEWPGTYMYICSQGYIGAHGTSIFQTVEKLM